MAMTNGRRMPFTQKAVPATGCEGGEGIFVDYWYGRIK